MKKYIFTLLFVLMGSISVYPRHTDAVADLIRRVTGSAHERISLRISKSTNDSTAYQYTTRRGELQLTASDNVALCRAFYDYVKDHGLGMYTWSGNSITLPASFPDGPSVRKVSPFPNHYYFNVCTFGYSMPYWDWERWEEEIDWMALHGINMPLALVAYEPILARVWRKMGLTDDEINAYFVGPAHLPWMRMGNISGIDGPLNDDWYARQIALQHQILDRMRSLDMKPICPAFAGFVTQAFQRLYPQLHLTETSWGGAFHNWMLSPEEPLFAQIAEAFIHEWEKEFGRCTYYLADSFNEMDIPFPAKGNPARYDMAAMYGEKVYQSIHRANKDAVWVMQGWMFGYQRDIWDYETLGALVSRVPDERMLLLDLAVDYNKHFWHSQVNWEYYKGFYDKQWVYSVIPNMGGKCGMTGILDFYANGHLEALSSPYKGHLVAHGMAPEGIENNEVLYELITDAGWSHKHIDVREWLYRYSLNRYGKAPDVLMQAWDHLLRSSYGTFTDHPRFNWQFRPGLVAKGSVEMSDDYFAGIEAFLAAADDLKKNPYYLTDLSEMMSLYLGAKADILVRQIDQQYLAGDTLRARYLESRFETLLRGIDLLLSHHPTWSLDRWTDFAARAASTPAQRVQYTTNARRIVTVWGPPVDDYSARIWHGLVGNYYLGRWEQYFAARAEGRTFDFAAWEAAWVEQGDNHPTKRAAVDVVALARELFALSRDISEAPSQL